MYEYQAHYLEFDNTLLHLCSEMQSKDQNVATK